MVQLSFRQIAKIIWHEILFYEIVEICCTVLIFPTRYILKNLVSHTVLMSPSEKLLKQLNENKEIRNWKEEQNEKKSN